MEECIMLRKLSLIFSLIIVIFILGCNGVKDPVTDGDDSPDDDQDIINATLDNEFRLEIHQTAFIESENIKIKFMDVTEDSRCPSEVVCVWAGQVKILVNISKDDEDLGDATLIADDDQAVKTFDGYSVRLLKVDPYPISTEQIELSDYIIIMIVTKTPN